jgi:two-component system sensor histidine kinase FlrB
MSEAALIREATSDLSLKEALLQFAAVGDRLEEKHSQLKIELERLKSQLEEKEKELEQRKKLSILGTYSAALAHEIRNPLGSIKLFLSVLKDEIKIGGGSLAGILSDIDASVSALEKTVGNVLQFSRGEKLQLTPINLASIVGEEAENFRLKNKLLKINTKLNLHGKTFILGNEQALRQLVINLLLNAEQAALANKDEREAWVSIEISNKQKNFLTLTILDSGRGFSREILDRLFEPFVTDKTSGTGLGLSLVKKIADQHQAKIEIFNRAGAVVNVHFSIKR